jgi:hypothetical protein
MPKIKIANFAPTPFGGWKRCKVDFPLPHPAAAVGGFLVVRGEPAGLDCHHVDIRREFGPLHPGEEQQFEMANALPAQFTRAGFPVQPIAFFGGRLMIDGGEATWVSMRANGAGYDCVLRGRDIGFQGGEPLGRRSVEVAFTWYPSTPWLAEGEVIVTQSNPETTELIGSTDGIDLRFGDAVVVHLGGQAWRPLQGGTVFADGQARAVPVLFVWLQHLPPEAWSDVAALANFGVSAVGIQKLWADGNPIYPGTFDARRWTNERLAEAMRRLHTWEPAMCGPPPLSAQSGEQEDSVFVRGEALLPGGSGAEKVAYLSALKLANRPCHHLEADGAQLDPARHTAKPLIFFGGRPHTGLWNIVDRLGKETGLAQSQVPGGWSGPDEEHAMFNTLAAACRLTSSHACQWLLRQQAIQYPLMWTVTHGWSTTQTYAARAIGWESLLVMHCWRELEDRELARKVRDHYHARLNTVLIPKLGEKPLDDWDVRLNDPRLGPGLRSIPWQQALGAYGMDYAGAQLGRADARAIALRGARRVFDHAWRKDGERWVCCASGLASVAEPGADQWAVYDESFAHYFMPLAACVILRHEPGNAKALEILHQVRSMGTEPKFTRYIAPGVL